MDIYQIFISSVLALTVLVGISMMSRVRTAVAGNFLSAVALLTGVGVTLLFAGILSVWTLWVAIAIGALVGSLLAQRVKMIQMPQMVALFNGLGGGASALVGMMTLNGQCSTLQGSRELAFAVGEAGANLASKFESEAAMFNVQFSTATALLAVAIGIVTLVGSLVAAGKLHRVLPQRPLVWKGHSTVTLLLLVITIVGVVLGTVQCSAFNVQLSMFIVFIASSLFGLWFSVRVGGADMPITISLLNSLSGVAGAIAGMAIGDVFLVAVGGIVGASGLLLTQIMCRAMNRSLLRILVPQTVNSKQSTVNSQQSTENGQLEKRVMDLEKRIQELEAIVTQLEQRVQKLQEESVAESQESRVESSVSASAVLSAAKDVIIVPGYGMALAQAQHQVRQLADKLESRGARVRFAIHPVAGRMPGHMNVLLAEADVDYEKLYEMDAINDDFANTDAVVVVGASDVLNPAARNAEGTPIYGMPVLNVDEAPEVIICNYDLKPGYAGVENPIYTREKGVHLELGDAKETLTRLIAEIK